MPAGRDTKSSAAIDCTGRLSSDQPLKTSSLSFGANPPLRLELLRNYKLALTQNKTHERMREEKRKKKLLFLKIMHTTQVAL